MDGSRNNRIHIGLKVGDVGIRRPGEIRRRAAQA